jgi:fibrillarin-like rRNA methylase
MLKAYGIQNPGKVLYLGLLGGMAVTFVAFVLAGGGL